MTKTCSLCKLVLPVVEFYPARKRSPYFQSRCKTCASKSRSSHYAAYREKERRRRKESYYANHEKSLENNRRKARARASSLSQAKKALKLEVIARYGGLCACCGEHRDAFLTLDHVNGDGKAHRAKVGSGGYPTYRDLKKRGWPSAGYRILCMNCNFATRLGGLCPHQAGGET